MAEIYGLEHIGFLTLTFADHVTDIREAQRRFNSFQTHVLHARYRAHISVLERSKNERIHFHLLVVLNADIRTGFDFDAIKNKDYKTANTAIRSEWKFLRDIAKKYRFGRTELLPIKSSVEAISRYVGKYIGKHMGSRKEQDKGARLVRYSHSGRMATTRFSFATSGTAKWRYKVALFASIICYGRGYPVPSFRGLRECLGPRWAYLNREFIMSLPDPELSPGQSPQAAPEFVQATLPIPAEPRPRISK